MIREILKIDEEKCNGCSLCVPACVEGALKIIDGKAKLVSEVYCDGIAGAVIEARDKTLPGIKVDVHTIGIKGDIHRDTA